MAPRQAMPLPAVVERSVGGPSAETEAARPPSAAPKAPPAIEPPAGEWDTVLASRRLTASGMLRRTDAGWVAPAGLAATQEGDITFFSDGSWMRRNGDTYKHSDGSVTIRRGDTFFHSDGTWSRRVGHVVTRPDGRTCVLTASSLACP